MAQVIEKIVRSKYPPRDTRVLWLDANDNAIKSFINGKWESTKGVALSGMMIETTYAELKEARDNRKLIPGQQYRITDYECTTSQENTKSAGHKFDIIVTADDEETLNEDARAIATEENFLDGSYFVNDGDHCVYKGERTVGGKKVYHWGCDGYDYEGAGYYTKLPIEQLVKLSKKELEQTKWKWVSNKEDFESIVDNWDAFGDYFIDISFTNYKIKPYFYDCNLSAWKLKYCLDNDTTRFKWAFKGGIESMESVLSNGLPLKRCPEFDGLSGKEGFYYAWGTDADIEDTDPANFVYSQVEYPILGDIVYKEDNLKTIPFEGKGVIYRMIDEWNNECPYDFKNILYKLQLNNYVLEKCNGNMGIHLISKEIINNKFLLTYSETIDTNYYYTFSKIDNNTKNIIDISTEQYKYPKSSLNEDIYYHTYDNEIKQYNKNGQLLNFICIISDDGCNYFDGISGNKFGISCHDITLCRDCAFNIFGNNCYNIFINADSTKLASNIFGDDSSSVVMTGLIINNNINGDNIALINQQYSNIYRRLSILSEGTFNIVYNGIDKYISAFRLEGSHNILLPGCLYNSINVKRNNMFIKPGEEVI